MSSNIFTKENLDNYLKELAKEFNINDILKSLKEKRGGK